MSQSMTTPKQSVKGQFTSFHILTHF